MNNLLKTFGKREKIILGVIVALMVFIPSGSFVLSEVIFTNSPGEPTGDYQPVTAPKEIPADTPLSKLVKELQASPFASPALNFIDVTPTSTDSATLLLGQTLGFRIIMEGRPVEQYGAKVFLGLSGGQPINAPKYLLSFLINVPQTGLYSGLPLAGLDEGQTYTAYIKGPAQLATASAFTVKPTPIDLGILNLITGDVNEDNVIDAADYNIVKAALGLTSSAQRWNDILDFNRDGRINSLDLAIVSKNLGKVGMSGPWYSSQQQATKSATISGSLNPAGSPDNSPQTDSTSSPHTAGTGYWMWMPTEF